MHSLVRLLSLLLCFELIVGPQATNLFLASNAMAEDCKKGFVKMYGRCVVSDQTAKVIGGANKCANDDKECFKRNSEGALNNSSAADDDRVKRLFGKGLKGNNYKSFATVGLASLAVTASAHALWQAKKNGVPCKSASIYAMLGAGAALGLGEALTNLGHRRRLKQNLKDWKALEGTSETKKESIEIQSKAFEFMALNEESIKKASAAKSVYFGIATSAFAASAALATMEAIKLKSLKNAYQFELDATKKAQLGLAYLDYVSRTTCFQSEELKKCAGGGLSKNNLATLSNSADPKGFRCLASTPTPADVDRPSKNMDVDKALSTVNTGMKFVPPKVSTDDVAPADIPSIPENKNNDAEEDELERLKKLTFNADEYCKTNKLSALDCSNYKKDLFDKIHEYNEKNRKKSGFIIKSPESLDVIAKARNVPELLHLADKIEFESLPEVITSASDYEKTLNFNKETDSFLLPLMKKLIIDSFLISSAHAEKLEDYKPVKFSLDSHVPSDLGSINHKDGDPLATDYEDISDYVNKDGGALGKDLASYTRNPKTRAIFAGLLTGWSGLMTIYALQAKKDSKERAEALRNMQEEFNTAGGLMYKCEKADLNNSAKPSCYCYTENGQRNMARSSSKICQNLWAGKNLNPNDYSDTDGNDRKVCLASSGKADTRCSCKINNTCMNISSGLKGLDIGSFKMALSSLKPIDDIASSSFNPAAINADGLLQNAIKLREASDNLAAKNAPELLSDQRAVSDKIAGLAVRAGSNMGLPEPLSSGNSPLKMTPAEAVKKLEEDFKPATGQGSFSIPSVSSDFNMGSEPDFGLSNNAQAVQALEIAEVLNKDMDFRENDVHSTSTTNIFEVLSNRYQRSGMRRLFQENSKQEADKPAKSDISN